MGNCTSSPVPAAAARSEVTCRNNNNSSRVETATSTVVHANGKTRVYGGGTIAGAVVAGNPGYYLCSSETMHVGERVPSVAADDELQPGQIYFLLPLTMAKQPLSLPYLCDLAVKASDALRHQVKEPS